MPIIKAVFGFLFVLLGVSFAVLNRTPLAIDLFIFKAQISAGTLLPIVLLVGVLIGGLAVLMGVVWPLRRALNRAQAAQQVTVPSQGNPPV